MRFAKNLCPNNFPGLCWGLMQAQENSRAKQKLTAVNSNSCNSQSFMRNAKPPPSKLNNGNVKMNNTARKKYESTNAVYRKHGMSVAALVLQLC